MTGRAATITPRSTERPAIDLERDIPPIEEPSPAGSAAHTSEPLRDATDSVPRVRESLRSFLIQFLLYGVDVLTALGVCFWTIRAANQMPLTSFERLLVGSAVAAIPLLPLLLTFCLSRMVTHSLDARLEYGRGATFEARPSKRSADDAWIARSARRLWSHEAAQVAHAGSRMREHAAIYGFVASWSLCFVAFLLVTAAFARQLDAAAAAGHYRVPFALAVGAAIATTFIREIGRMLVRAANRDSSTPMFAWATKRLLLIISGTLLLCCMAFVVEDLRALIKGTPGWLLLGVGMAVLGDRAVDAVDNRAARLLGVAQRRSRDDDDDLRRIDGLGDDDLVRLAEEGVDSVHTLAFQSTPKLFFSTPYALHRICDWQDQSLLLVRLGPSRARVFREQLGVRGAIDACHLVEDILALPEGDERAGDMMRLLGFPADAQGRAALERIVADESIARLDVFRRAIPSHKVDAAMEKHHEP
jgi:hypothetical protein